MENIKREKARIADRKYKATHKEILSIKAKEWRLAHPEWMTEMNRRWRKIRRSSPKGRLNHNISTRIWFSLKGLKASKHWEDLVGYTLTDLKNHLQTVIFACVGR